MGSRLPGSRRRGKFGGPPATRLPAATREASHGHVVLRTQALEGGLCDVHDAARAAPMTETPPTSAARRRDWTVLEVLGWTTQRFTERGLPTPRLDAELVIAHALGFRRIDLYVRSEQLLSSDELARIRDVVRRRQEGESVAYVTGEKEFWGLPFKVTADVLVPRPDTETLVEAALERLPRDQARRVLDIGTGSGAIAVAIAKSRPQTVVWATDVSPAALAIARHNAERNGVNVNFAEGHLLDPVAQEAPFDVIVSNPPYIPTADIAGLADEVKREPMLALDGGQDGLHVIRELVTAAKVHLAQGGWLLLELGQGQANAVRELCLGAGLQSPVVLKDLAGVERVVGARHGDAPVVPDPIAEAVPEDASEQP